MMAATNDNNAAVLAVAAGVAALVLMRRKPVATVTTSEGFDLSPYGGAVTYPQGIYNVAQAIARAEGFYAPGSIPQRAHNPGDLKVPDAPTVAGGSGITAFANDDAGWAALYRQLYRILTGQSTYYTIDDTIRQMANNWTATQQAAWADNVAAFLGVDPSTKLWEVLA